MIYGVSYINRCSCFRQITVKSLNFWTPENFVEIYLTLEKMRPNHRVFCLKNENRIANSEDPDQTAPQGAV